MTTSASRTTTQADSVHRQIIDLWYARLDVWPWQWFSKERQVGGYSKACQVRPPWTAGKCPKKGEGQTCATCPSFEGIPVDERIIKMHLSGIITAGSYQIAQDTTSVKWLCLDFDSHPDFTPEQIQADALVARASLADLNIPTVIEASGGTGWRCHLWGFFLAPIAAIKARTVIDAALAQAGLADRPFIERFPKQTRALSGFGNLVKVPFGINRKTQGRSRFLREDLSPVEDLEEALGLIEPVDPTVIDYTIDMRHLTLVEPEHGAVAPAKNFDLPASSMRQVLGRCWYFREVERQQMNAERKVHYEDWWNYLLMMARFGDAGVERIMQLSALDERFDPYYTMVQINYVRQRGYHAPSCNKRLRQGPGMIHCPQDPLLCGAA